MGIDFNKIDEFIEKIPKPNFCEVDEKEWRNSLHGIRETMLNIDLDGFTTETLWSSIYISAVSFCKGMMWAETKAGLRKESNYPRY